MTLVIYYQIAVWKFKSVHPLRSRVHYLCHYNHGYDLTVTRNDWPESMCWVPTVNWTEHPATIKWYLFSQFILGQPIFSRPGSNLKSRVDLSENSLNTGDCFLKRTAFGGGLSLREWSTRPLLSCLKLGRMRAIRSAGGKLHSLIGWKDYLIGLSGLEL